MGDKTALEQLQARIRKTPEWQARVKAEAESATPKPEQGERQERP